MEDNRSLQFCKPVVRNFLFLTGPIKEFPALFLFNTKVQLLKPKFIDIGKYNGIL